MKILVTGGAGFIGSHLCEKLIEEHHEVVVLDNFSTGSQSNLELIDFTGELVVGDIRNSDLVNSLVSKSDVVVHLAAALGVDNIMFKTIDSISTNVFGSEVVLQSCSEFNKRVIIASSSEVYGKNPKQPLFETDDRVIGSPQNFRWSYSDSKALEESIARVLHLENKLPVTTLRFFNTVGPRQSAQYGMVLPRFIKSAISNSNLKVYGDGSQTRVFGHVKDAVSAIEVVIGSENTIGEVFNVGGVGEISILDLARLVIEVTQSRSQIEFVPYSVAYPFGYEDMERRVPNTEKLQSYTGWKASKVLIETIEDMCSFESL
jgi:UDP-glucose 4-epimerase